MIARATPQPTARTIVVRAASKVERADFKIGDIDAPNVRAARDDALQPPVEQFDKRHPFLARPLERPEPGLVNQRPGPEATRTSARAARHRRDGTKRNAAA